MHDVLAFATNFTSWDGSIAYAASLAARLDGHLTGIFIQPSPLLMMPEYSSAALPQAMIDNARDIERKARAAQAEFTTWAKAQGANKSSWQVTEGHAPEVLTRMANWHDLLVLERNPKAPWGSPADIGALILRTHLPCLVVPRDRPVARLDRIVLAWNGSAESVRAVHASIPLLKLASQVLLLDGEQRDPAPEAGDGLRFDIEAHLRRHSIEVERTGIGASDEEAGETLIGAAMDMKADLLVMGAYGRTRISEWAFGGATRKVLTDAPIPLFLRH